MDCLQLSARYFCAAVVLERGQVVRAAPILRYMVGWASKRVIEYAQKKGWRCAWVPHE